MPVNVAGFVYCWRVLYSNSCKSEHALPLGDGAAEKYDDSDEGNERDDELDLAEV